MSSVSAQADRMTISKNAPSPSWTTAPENPLIFPGPLAKTANSERTIPARLTQHSTRLFSSGRARSRNRTTSAVATTRVSGRMLYSPVSSAWASIAIGGISFPHVEVAGQQGLPRRTARQRRLTLRLDLRDDRGDRGVHLPEERLRVDPDPEDHHEDRQQVGHLPRVQVRHVPVLLVGDLPEHHPLVHPEHIDRRHDHEDGGEQRGDLGEPPELLDEARMPPFVDDPDDEEERAGGNAVVDHLEDAALDPLEVEGEKPEHHEAQV